MFKRTKAILLKIDDFREEKLEDFLADEILGKIDSCNKVDELERTAILAGLKAANIYITTYGVPEIPQSVQNQIADVSIKALNRGNKLLQKQLKKKSKSYTERHKNDSLHAIDTSENTLSKQE